MMDKVRRLVSSERVEGEREHLLFEVDVETSERTASKSSASTSKEGNLQSFHR